MKRPIEVKGDITNFPKAQIIAHQCNCVSTGAAGGVARSIFDKFPYADTYSKRKGKEDRSKPGTISIHGNGKDKRLVMNLYAQYYPGGSKYENDTPELREKWMKECFAKIYNIRKKIKSIAFPRLMGCAIAGGNWENYYSFICKLQFHMPDTDIYIVEFNKND